MRRRSAMRRLVRPPGFGTAGRAYRVNQLLFEVGGYREPERRPLIFSGLLIDYLRLRTGHLRAPYGALRTAFTGGGGGDFWVVEGACLLFACAGHIICRAEGSLFVLPSEAPVVADKGLSLSAMQPLLTPCYSASCGCSLSPI